MGAERILWVLELPEPMNAEQAAAWESINRPEGMVWLEKMEPVGPLPAKLWEAHYEMLDPVAEGLCS